MADRDLRALDMRHTLPNLKNLLLTLTDGEGALVLVLLVFRMLIRAIVSPQDSYTGQDALLSRQ